ncbi:hypothetical protein GL4_1418 [Methyloceanibacter caenitepidi]|uniref:Alkaline proteinase inhibitor/ Outer membrane lipoprotein Omp19 domain-containing protein n=2 Tax=Methyloceanibacter caenitepidi TaxID=1384459 RepID=A0A0A8K1W5_9HYPH|nr:hypothetical protein GL4_1418 [Methyloceanibacter caenitepidi]
MQVMGNRLSRGYSMVPGREFAQVTGRAFCGFALLALTVAMAPSTAASAAALAGEWSGEGTVTQTEGPTEKVRCRVSYKQESAKVFGVVAKCASTSQMMNQTGELLEVRPGVFTGEFNLTQYDVSGRVRVVLDGETQTVTFKSPKGEGEVILNRQ